MTAKEMKREERETTEKNGKRNRGHRQTDRDRETETAIENARHAACCETDESTLQTIDSRKMH